MANAASNITTLGANLKVQYAPAIVNLVPSQAILQSYRSPNAPGADPKNALTGAAVSVPIDWTNAERNGKNYSVPTKYQSGQGVSYLGTSGDLADLQDALQTKIAEVQVDGYELNVRQQVTYKTITTADGGLSKAVEATAQIVMDDMKDVAYNRQEFSALFGQTYAGVIESQTLSGTTLTVVFTDASFVPGWWVANIASRVEFFDTDYSYFSDATSANYATVVSVDIANKTVVFTVDNTGTKYVSTSEPAPGDYCLMKGACAETASFNEMVGLYKQLTNTSSTIFNVARNTITAFQPTAYSAAGALTKAKVIRAAAKLFERGQVGRLVLLCSPATWADLAAEDLAARMFDSSWSERTSKSGSQELCYWGVNGEIRVVCHPFVMDGFAFLFNPEQVAWVGSSDVRFLGFGTDIKSQSIWQPVPGKNALELQVYADKQIFHEAPSQGLVISGIVNAS